jgi:hypothetical protein
MGDGKLHECRAARPAVEEVSNTEQSSATIPSRAESVLIQMLVAVELWRNIAIALINRVNISSTEQRTERRTIRQTPGLPAADAILDGLKQPQNKWPPWDAASGAGLPATTQQARRSNIISAIPKARSSSSIVMEETAQLITLLSCLPSNREND